ncbi:MAG: DEAD/DEAH box helicase [Pseudomonadota bacterium]
MKDFNTLEINDAILNSLRAMQYTSPTPIQAQTIPVALKGLDIIGTAQTGTGKTAAYGIPLISHLLDGENSSALVLTPTRELAVQVLKLLEQILGRKTNIKSALIIGGDSIQRQLDQLGRKPRLIVGTPGRINDHLDRGSLKLDTTQFLVLDETDRMLDMGFGIQLDEIIKYLPLKRQTLMFSATLPSNIQKLASKYMQDATRITVGSTITAAETIKQEVIHASDAEKRGILLDQLSSREGSCIIFVKTKLDTEKLANKLREFGHSADAIHGDLRQRNRDKVINGFRNKKYRILVATDIAARGLDIPHVEHVVNYDLPQCEEDFIHRIGRTGRAGVEGNAISLVSPQDSIKWKNICRMMNPSQKFDDEKRPKRGDSRNSSRRPSFKKRDDSRFEERAPRKPSGDSKFGFRERSSERSNNRFGFGDETTRAPRKPLGDGKFGFRERSSERSNNRFGFGDESTRAPRKPSGDSKFGFRERSSEDSRKSSRGDNFSFRGKGSEERKSFRNSDVRKPRSFSK